MRWPWKFSLLLGWQKTRHWFGNAPGKTYLANRVTMTHVSDFSPVTEGRPSDHLHEDALEPHHLIRRSDAVLRAGSMMLGAGTGSRRVKETMIQVARALDLDTMQAQITLTEIICTVSRRGVFRTQVAEVVQPGVNAQRAAELQELTRTLQPGTTVKEINKKLDEIEKRKSCFPTPVVVLMVALACIGMVFLNGGSFYEVLPVGIASGFAYYVRRKLGEIQFSQVTSVFIGGFLTCGGFWCLSHLANLWLNWPLDRQTAGFVATAIFLVPGFPLVTASLDIARLDLEAGMSRLTYAGLIMLSAGLGVWVVTVMARTNPQPVPSPDWHPGLQWTMYAIASFLAVSGWSFMFNAPLRVCLVAGGFAVVTNVPKIFAVSHGVPAHMAVAGAALIVGLLSWIVGEKFHLPRIILSVPAVIVLVPGATAYQGLVHFTDGNLGAAGAQLTEATLITMGICIGLAASRILTDPRWSFSKSDYKYLKNYSRPLWPKVSARKCREKSLKATSKSKRQKKVVDADAVRARKKEM